MKNKRYSIKDIAAELNLSATTISFVLNGKAKEKRISDEVTQKVLKYAKKINYKPNQLAQSLRTGKSKILVFMVEDISNHFFAKLARIIEVIAYKKGYKVLFCSNENKDDKSIELINLFKDRQVDGYIIIPSAGIESHIKELIEEKIPVVLFDRYFPGLDTNYVGVDNEKAAYAATQHLIDNQFQNIAFITLDVDQTQMADRLKGYKNAVKDAGLKEQILQIPYEKELLASGKEIIRDFLLNNPQLDAIFFATNYLTQKGLGAIKENFPDLITEIGVITFDDHELFNLYTPSISAVSQPCEQLGEELMGIMLKLLKDSSVNLPIERVVLETELQVRDSSICKKVDNKM